MKKNNSVFHGQPPEWEKILEDVTYKQDHHLVDYDPDVLDVAGIGYSLPFFRSLLDKVDEESKHQISEIRRIVYRKVPEKMRKIFLKLLSDNCSLLEIAEQFSISEDTVRRYIQKTVKICREIVRNRNRIGDFPKKPGTRPRIKATLFSLDTQSEKMAFQEFLNHNQVQSISYNTECGFSTALVVFLQKPHKKALKKVHSDFNRSTPFSLFKRHKAHPTQDVEGVAAVVL